MEFEQASHLFLHDTHHHHHHHEDPPPPPPKEDMATNLTLKHFLEGIVMDKVKGLPMEALMKALVGVAIVIGGCGYYLLFIDVANRYISHKTYCTCHTPSFKLHPISSLWFPAQVVG